MLALPAASLLSCGEENTGAAMPLQGADTVPPVIVLLGEKVDTAFLQVSSTTLIAGGASNYTWLPGNSAEYYADKGAIIRGDNGQRTCQPVEATGTVNNRMLGTYYIQYNASDAAGNKAAAVTRTVHVVNNPAAGLNGSYDVACSCTAAISGSPGPLITTGHYTAMVSLYPGKGCFELSALNIGPERVIPFTSLHGSMIDISYFSVDGASGNATGTLSPANNTFTIESRFYTYFPRVAYKCKNLYTKQGRPAMR